MKRLKITVVVIGLMIICTWAKAEGTLTGTIKFSGIAPNKKTISMDADAICYAIHKSIDNPKAMVLGDGNTLGNVFVYIKSGLSKANYVIPSEPVVIDQEGCNYSPHVIGVLVGQKVKILNPDGTLHNVHGAAKVNQEFNASMPAFRKEMEMVFKKPEFMFPLRCDVHPWMLAWVAVMEHPYFTVTNSDGKFEIKNLPPGTYTIEAWHEKLGIQTAAVTITDGQSQTQDFSFSAPK